MLSSSKPEDVSQNSFVFKLAGIPDFLLKTLPESLQTWLPTERHFLAGDERRTVSRAEQWSWSGIWRSTVGHQRSGKGRYNAQVSGTVRKLHTPEHLVFDFLPFLSIVRCTLTLKTSVARMWVHSYFGNPKRAGFFYVYIYFGRLLFATKPVDSSSTVKDQYLLCFLILFFGRKPGPSIDSRCNTGTTSILGKYHVPYTCNNGSL